jgi:predicted nucleotidyltransferase
MDSLSNILSSFNLQETLNPKVFENSDRPKESVMKSKVRNALLKIADEFISGLDDKIEVVDVVLTGSLANYNWSKYSDFDLHVIIDYSVYGKQKELYQELFQLKKQLFNQKHDISIFGYEVELYPQDEKESHFSTGTYSIMTDEWINVPTKEEFKIDKSTLKVKVDGWRDKIENIISSIKSEGMKKNENKIDNLKKKIKEYRQSGLEEVGELSYENLVFKYLRRSGLMEKLYNTVNKQLDKELSLEVRKVD